MKIFIIYFNISYGNNSMEEFETLQNWYETNFDLIKNKLKRLYYISKKEMEKREYNIDKMLLFIKEDDNYNNSELKNRDNISHNYNKEVYEIIIKKIMKKDKDNKKYPIVNEKIKNKKKSNQRYCIIKFDLLLTYYSLRHFLKMYHPKFKKQRSLMAQARYRCSLELSCQWPYRYLVAVASSQSLVCGTDMGLR